jgi:hypothetical protein
MFRAGWQVAMAAYIDKINELYRKMFGILPDIFPANRRAVDQYLNMMWRWCYRITEAFEYRYVTAAMRKVITLLTADKGRQMTGPKRCSMCTGILVKDINVQRPAVGNQVVSPTSLVSPELAQPLDVPATGARDEDVDLRTKFRKYVAKEESWLDRNLKEVRYDLDSVDSVHLILGSDLKIEKV